MSKVRRKITKYEIILCVLVLAVIVAGLLLPKTGELVLLDEFCNISVIWIVCIYVVVRVIHNWKTGEKSNKTAGVIIAVFCAAVCMWFTKDFAADLASGTKTVTLTDIEVSETQAHTSIFSHHYYLMGTDSQGLRTRVEISADDYTMMSQTGNGTAVLVYYDTAMFTNLTQDHLDYHKTMENYALAKAKLFDSLSAPNLVKSNKNAIINLDDELGSKTMIEHTKCNLITYGIKNDATLKAENVEIKASGASFDVKYKGEKAHFDLKVTGMFNVYNILGVIGVALAEKISFDIIKETLEAFEAVAGRFELIRQGQDFSVIVDYAHTPDGLENVLKTAREIAKKRLIVVFGCGGDRDRTKRPIMGRIAAQLADVVIATSDNPRTEDPEFILSEVEAGVLPALHGNFHEKITDRKTAIFRAIELAQKDDIVLIAGKGHENYQILKTGTIHFDDKEVAIEAIRGKING